MAVNAVARDVVACLRRNIARIEGRLAERLEDAHVPPFPGGILLRRSESRAGQLLATGAADFDAAIGGGLPLRALTEIHGARSHDAGAVAGFALGLAGLFLAKTSRRGPVLWIGSADVLLEGGLPYLAGVRQLRADGTGDLLIARPDRLTDALWIADEAAALTELSAVFLEVRGSPRQLDLTATRRLHWRARAAGRPLFLLRQAAHAEPTAAPLRLVVSPAPSAARETLAGPLAGSIGRPAFTVRVDKSHAAPPRQFILEWNRDDRRFRQAGDQDTGALVSASPGGPHGAPAAGAILAFKSAGGEAAAARVQPARGEHATHRRARRTG